MDLSFLDKPHVERITEWVTGGQYAVAVEVEATISPRRLDAPCLKPETVRFLEELARAAEAGDVETLKKAGTVYVLLEKAAPVGTNGVQANLTDTAKKVVAAAG